MCVKKRDLMTEKDNSFNLKYATFSAKKFKRQLTLICTQLGQKVIEFAFEYPFEFNDFAVVQKYLVESLTLYAISKEVRPHCIIFKLN